MTQATCNSEARKNAISLDSNVQQVKVEERVYHCKNETLKLNFLRTKAPPSDLQRTFAGHRIWFGTINFAEKSPIRKDNR